MDITITTDDFTQALGVENKKYFLSSHVKNVQAALTEYHLKKGDPRLEPTVRNDLYMALFNWKTQKPQEFEKYDAIADGAVRKLSVQCGIDSFRPASPNTVLFHANRRDGATHRVEANVTRLDTDMVATLREYVSRKRKVAVLVIDLYGEDFHQQGLENRYAANPATVMDNIKALLGQTRMQIGKGEYLHLPVYIVAKKFEGRAVGRLIAPEFKSAISSCYQVEYRSPTSNVLQDNGLVAELRSESITDVFVVGFDANICVGSSIFGSKSTAPYHAGLLDLGFNVVTSRYVVASGNNPLLGDGGWPYMGTSNV